MVNTETGELIERRLDHSNGEAKKFYAELQKPAGGGHGSHRLRAMVRADASQAGIRALDRGCGGDTGGDGAEAEDRFAGCSAHSRSTPGEPVSADLDSLPGGTGSAAAPAASPQDGWLTNFGKKPVAGAGHGPRRLPQKKVVGGRGTERTASSAVGSMGESATGGTAGNPGPAGSNIGGSWIER